MMTSTPQQIVAGIESSTGSISAAQHAVNTSGMNMDVNDIVTSLATILLDAKEMAATDNVIVPEGMVEKVDATMQNLTIFSKLSNDELKMLTAKLIQLRKIKEMKALHVIMVSLKPMMSAGEVIITPTDNTSAASDVVEAEKPTSS